MRIRNTILAIASILLLGGTMLTGCTSDTTTNPTATDNRLKFISGSTDVKTTITGLAPSTLYIFSVSGSSSSTVISGAASSSQSGAINIFWTRGSGDTGQDTVYYIADSLSTASTTGANGVPAITWATANYTSSLKIYETSDPSSSDPSGLIISGSGAVTSALNASTKGNVDIGLNTDATVPGSNISLESSNVIYTGGRSTYFGTNVFQVQGGADNIHFSGDITSQIPTTSGVTNYFDIPSNSYTGTTACIPVYTQNGTFALVEVVPDATTGLLYSVDGVSGFKYITVNVFTQPTANWGYVSRPPSNHGSTLAPKGPTPVIVHE